MRTTMPVPVTRVCGHRPGGGGATRAVYGKMWYYPPSTTSQVTSNQISNTFASFITQSMAGNELAALTATAGTSTDRAQVVTRMAYAAEEHDLVPGTTYARMHPWNNSPIEFDTTNHLTPDSMVDVWNQEVTPRGMRNVYVQVSRSSQKEMKLEHDDDVDYLSAANTWGLRSWGSTQTRIREVGDLSTTWAEKVSPTVVRIHTVLMTANLNVQRFLSDRTTLTSMVTDGHVVVPTLSLPLYYQEVNDSENTSLITEDYTGDCMIVLSRDFAYDSEDIYCEVCLGRPFYFEEKFVSSYATNLDREGSVFRVADTPTQYPSAA